MIKSMIKCFDILFNWDKYWKENAKKYVYQLLLEDESIITLYRYSVDSEKELLECHFYPNYINYTDIDGFVKTKQVIGHKWIGLVNDKT